ncbi:MAG: FtsX-like permease family protein [Gemmatimonadota bacterium]
MGTVGLYGTLSYVVGQRTREIGIRMAMGGEMRHIRGIIVRQGSQVGIGLGLGTALLITGFLESLLFEVQAADPAVLTTMCVVMLGVALVASYLPARRASGVDPMVALRVE